MSYKVCKWLVAFSIPIPPCLTLIIASICLKYLRKVSFLSHYFFTSLYLFQYCYCITVSFKFPHSNLRMNLIFDYRTILMEYTILTFMVQTLYEFIYSDSLKYEIYIIVFIMFATASASFPTIH